jgi:hypothetical protein
MHYNLVLRSSLTKRQRIDRFNSLSTSFAVEARLHGIKNSRIENSKAGKKNKRKLCFQIRKTWITTFVTMSENSIFDINIIGDHHPLSRSTMTDIFCKVLEANELLGERPITLRPDKRNATTLTVQG